VAERPEATRPRRPPRGGPGARGGGRRYPKGPSRARIIIRRIVALSAIVGAAVIVWFLIELYQPFAGSGHGRITVTIPADSGTDRIGQILAADGVVSSSFFFELRARLDGGRLYAGRFRMPLATTYSRAMQILSVEPKALTKSVTIIDGLSRPQIWARLRAARIRGNYLAQTRHSRLLDPVTYGAPKSTPYLEGFLFPDTYSLRVPVKLQALVNDQLEAFKRAFATVGMGYARAHHLTPYDVLIVASLTEAEATTNHDRPLVAAVIYNRLAAGIELGFDTTVAYATGDYSGNLTARELASRSPWNTTNHHGLPPTPINSPSLEAINAAAHPAHTNDLYFITKVCGNGALAFTSSFSAFQQLSAEYNAAFAKHGLRGAEFCK
jgi:UPF0755 protein